MVGALERLKIIDGFRGFFLFFMGLVHFNGQTRSVLGWYSHHQFGWVEDAQGFVFISGLMVGIVYGRKYLRMNESWDVYVPVLSRIFTIYQHQAVLILMMLVAAFALGAAAPGELHPYQNNPVTFTTFSLLLVSASAIMGILPMYIYFLLLTPVAFWAISRGHVVSFVLVSALLWFVAQVELAEVAAVTLQELLAEHGVVARFGFYFNAFAWQVLFFSGLYFGYRSAEGKLDLSFLATPQWRAAFFVALIGVVGLGLFDLAVEHNWFGDDYTNAVYSRTNRSALSFVYLIAFFLDLFVVVWLLQAGRQDRAFWIRSTSRGIDWLFTRRPLVFLGQHSLHVFSAHVLVYYLLATVMLHVELNHFFRSLVLIAAMGSLFLAAYAHAWLQARDAAPVLASPGAAGSPG